MISFEQKLSEYAALLVRAGMNVRPDQPVAITTTLDCAPLVRLCVDECYKVGAREVFVDWGDDYCTRQRYLHAQDQSFDLVPDFLTARYEYYRRESCALLSLKGSDPELLAGVAPDRISRWKRVFGASTEPFHNAMITNRFQWCVAAWPTEAWAKKVFPDLGTDEAVNALWDAVFTACRITGDGGAVARWEAHVARQKRVLDVLDGYKFASLHYQNSLGTNLTVRLPAGHYWTGGSERAGNGHEFIANIPTEEVFTAPQWDGVDGVVYASMPLSLDGNLVKDFHLTIEGGKIVGVHAREGEEVLKNSIAMDEGSSYLGEVALVPYDSPIRNTGLLFYNTLFDENASCHFAFGSAYPCVEGAGDLTPGEQKELGLNQSKNHVDFMVGTADLSVVGTTHSGAKITVFKDGNFAF